ncbi:hypothetical protein ANCCAN_22658 [Ancylostoma caninum]|uniref:Uncharacterized protein n=1 Tax=Ancylostoma caninum TaxID=29170 RepID=A0A368FH71_ANCCA|nr:hypothetical protein ANCCAN_22658 [Ancylostoma caninum]
MSLCDLKEYFHDYHKLINGGLLARSGRRRRCDNYPSKKVSDRVVAAKIVYDPQNTLSKRAYKRLLAVRSDGFCPDVPYSLNKRGGGDEPCNASKQVLLEQPGIVRYQQRGYSIHLWWHLPLVKIPGPLAGSARCRRFDNYAGKKVSDRVVAAKIVYDPQYTLSKRAYKRLLADRSDGFCPGVPYSLNKRGRWEKMSPASLLSRYSSNSPELCVINREVTPFIFGGGFDIITDNLTKTAEDREEVESARIHFNIVTPPRILRANARRFRQANRTIVKGSKTELPCYNSEMLPDMDISTDNVEDSDVDDFCYTSRKFTLGDFITSKHPSTSSHGVKSVRSGSGGSSSSFEIVSIKPAAMTDISEATNSTHIFEIIDIDLNSLDSFDLEEEIRRLLPGYYKAQWFSPERVSIASKRSVAPMFVIFFEVWERCGILRIRINIKAKYSPEFDKEILVKLLHTRKNFPSLFADLISFIFSLEPMQLSFYLQRRFLKGVPPLL